MQFLQSGVQLDAQWYSELNREAPEEEGVPRRAHQEERDRRVVERGVRPLDLLDLGFGVWGLGFGVWGLGFGVRGVGFGVWGYGLGFRVWVQGSGFRVSASGFRVQG